jgi:hypothetical protein
MFNLKIVRRCEMFQDALIAGLFAGVVAISVTLLVEKLGGAIGGILGTIPTTIVPASIGVALATDIVDFRMSMAVVPLGMLINGIFLANWKILPTYFNHTENKYTTLIIIIFISLFIWLFCGLIILNLINLASIAGIPPLIIGLIGLLLVAILGITMCWHIGPTPSSKNKVNIYVLLSRGMMAAFAIGIAVWISGLGYPLIAGLATVFPAIFLTSMVALWISQGPSVPMGAAGPMMLGGASVALYSIIAIWSFPMFGIFQGTLLAWAGSIIFWSFPSFQFVRWRQRKSKIIDFQ